MLRKMSRVVFPYVIVFAVLISLFAGIGMMAGMRWWEILLWCVGTCLVVGGIIFTFFEVRRLAGITNPGQLALEEEEADRLTRHLIVVEESTGDPCPHHEDYPGSAGFDQGQLTSRDPGSTPLIEDLLRRRRQRHGRSV